MKSVSQKRDGHPLRLDIMKEYEQVSEEVTIGDTTYLVEGRHRDWNPLWGTTPPEGTVWELTATVRDSDQIAFGFAGTKEDAMNKLIFNLGFYAGMREGGGRA